MNDLIKVEILQETGLIKQKEVELAKKAELAIVKCEKSLSIWNRSHSDFMWKNMTVGGEYGPLRRLRQISAQLSNKKNAMIEAKYGYLNKIKLAQLKRAEAEKEPEPLKKDYLLFKAQELEDKARMVEQPYLGCVKDVLELSKIYDTIVNEITEKYGKFDEEVFEVEESKYWVKRSFYQSLRDIRERGTITKGEQELLEQIGLDPQVIEKMLRSFIQENMESNNPNSEKLDKFIDECSERFYIASADKRKRIMIPIEIDKDHLFLDEPKIMDDCGEQ